jgi:hypothetical protein
MARVDRTGGGKGVGGWPAGLRESSSRRVACPKCGAQPPSRCRGVRSMTKAYRNSPHPERVAAFRGLGQPEPPAGVRPNLTPNRPQGENRG